MRYDLYYGVYRKVCFTNPLNRLLNESYNDIIETEFPTEYDPEMSHQTKTAMHNELMYTLMEDTRGWTENVFVGTLLDNDLKMAYIHYYSSGTSLSHEYILTHCPATQPNIDKIPRTMDYIPNKRYQYKMTLVQRFYYYYYNKRYQHEYGIDGFLPVFLPKEPIHHYWDIIMERMDKLNPPKKRKR